MHLGPLHTCLASATAIDDVIDEMAVRWSTKVLYIIVCQSVSLSVSQFILVKSKD